MNANTTAECREDTYVVCPNPTYLPDCEDGWEIGQDGVATCAVPQPLQDLPATGADVPVEFVLGGVLLAIVGLAIITRRRWTRG